MAVTELGTTTSRRTFEDFHARRAGDALRYATAIVGPREAEDACQEAWLGDWWAFDPTNGVSVGERHAVVGRGRDYADVPPLKGVYNTGTPEALDVEVRITRLA